ncbi:MAG TPA: phage/plasmid primase, P4 family [Pseudonocardiaceae bacterium]|nr:phage/plasmid primase, P4 family [Pseudonocardiaceae bacterium]
MTSAALAWCTAGCSVVRVAVDGSKAPLGAWKTAQHDAADEDTIRAWFDTGHPGLGVVCGAVSGGLEMLEIEGRATQNDPTLTRFLLALAEHGLAEVRDRIFHGYLEQSPSGGLHLYYRVADGPALGNVKLARRPTPDGPVPLIETRGEGGFVVVAPSHGNVHPTGAPWVALTGFPHSIATITADERDAVHDVARTLDELPPPEPLPDPVPLDKRDGRPPGADYNDRADWTDVLTPAGWQVVSRQGSRTFWRRPGKRMGISAVTGGPAGDYLWVWSTSTTLPSETGLSKWRAYALLNHQGDFHAAAKALGAAGYGDTPTPPRQPHRPVLTVLPGRADIGPRNGALAPSTLAQRATTHARTDDALALALVDAHHGELRYVPERGRWLEWDGHRWHWCPPGDGPVRERVKTLARKLPENDAADIRHKIHSLSAPGTTAIVRQAASDPRAVVHLGDLDARPFELNTPRGIVDLRSGALLAPDPTHLHTRSTTVAPNPDADPRAWHAFLSRTFAGQDDITAYVQRLVGYSATGAVLDQVLPFCYGSGANGKSVLLGVLFSVLGDYATTAPAGFLMAQQFSQHATEIADLAGARLVICSELDEGDRFDESRVKLLTGKDPVKARFMRQDFFTFTPTHHLWLMGNHQPGVTAGGPAFWRRLRIIPFTTVVPLSEQDTRLADTLSAEHGEAVLAWIVAGAVDYLRTGLAEPTSVHVATEGYEHEQDTVAQFIEECCHVGGADAVRIRTGILRAGYERWCRGEGCSPVSAKAFTQALSRMDGIGTARSNGLRFITGVTLLEPAEGDERRGTPLTPFGTPGEAR